MCLYLFYYSHETIIKESLVHWWPLHARLFQAPTEAWILIITFTNQEIGVVLLWSITTLLKRKPLFCLSLNFCNFSRNWAWDFLTCVLTFTEMNWLEWCTLSYIILYIWIWFPSLTFWMQYRRNTDFWPIKTLNFGNWTSWFSYDFLKILTVWASFSYKLFSYKKYVYFISNCFKANLYLVR